MKASVIYRLPNEDFFYQIQGLLSTNIQNPISSGFIINSFDNSLKYCIHPENVIKTKNIHELNNNFSFQNFTGKNNAINYENALAKAIETVKNGSLFKVVISNNNAYDFDKTKILLFIQALANAFPETFTYLLQLPNNEIWFGASPETLIQEKNGTFETMALAGTMKSEEPISVNEWGNKEITEHKFVCDYLENTFKENKFEFQDSEIHTIKTGKIYHLKKNYILSLNNLSILELAEKIHPTPAVCGLPKENAMQFISKYEGYNREFYTGYLGPINIDNKNALFVNLRCGKLYNDKMLLFAGGGINPGSTISKETEEIAIKMQNTYQIYQSI